MGVLLGLGPGLGCHVLDLPVGQRRQAGEDCAQVVLWIDASCATGFIERKEDGAALSGFGFTDEQPVLFADGGGPDGILDGVVVDLDSSIFEIDGEHGPQGEGAVDGFIVDHDSGEF